MGTIQVVTKKGESPDGLVQSISKLKEHSSIGLIGTVKTSEKAPNGIEISPKDLRIFSSVEKIPPFDPHAKTVKNIDTRLEIRAIDLRRSTCNKFSKHEVMYSNQYVSIFMIKILLKLTHQK